MWVKGEIKMERKFAFNEIAKEYDKFRPMYPEVGIHRCYSVFRD